MFWQSQCCLMLLHWSLSVGSNYISRSLFITKAYLSLALFTIVFCIPQLRRERISRKKFCSKIICHAQICFILILEQLNETSNTFILLIILIIHNNFNLTVLYLLNILRILRNILEKFVVINIYF